MKLSVTRTTISIAISLVAYAGIFPVVFGLLARGLDQLLGLQPLFGPPLSNILTAALWLIGAYWIFWAYSYLLFVGGGLPVEVFGFALDPTKQLVTTGPYAFTRNPMIFGLIWVLAGVAALLGSASGLILLPVVIILATIYLRKYEEPGLQRRFGEEYEHYRRHVPLIFPHLVTYIKPEAVENGGG